MRVHEAPQTEQKDRGRGEKVSQDANQDTKRMIRFI